MCLPCMYLFKVLIHTSGQKPESSEGTLNPAFLSFLPFKIRIEDGLREPMSYQISPRKSVCKGFIGNALELTAMGKKE